MERLASPPTFFDPVIGISPGVTRELDVLVDYLRTGREQLTQLSLRYQQPILPWLQVSVEMPAVFDDPAGGASTLAAGDLLLQSQAVVWTPRAWPAEVDLGLELTLPTGGWRGGGSTAVRPFVVGAVKVGPLDVIGNLSYQWFAAGPFSGTNGLQASLSVGYPWRGVVPFAELTVFRPVHGAGAPETQLTVGPGFEVFFPWGWSLSVGAQFAVGAARTYDQRVLGFFKLPF
jgi:hypothetical protein